VNPIPKGQLNIFKLLLFLSHFIKSKEPLDACVLNFPKAKAKNPKPSKFCFCFCCLLRNESYQYCMTNKAHAIQTHLQNWYHQVEQRKLCKTGNRAKENDPVNQFGPNKKFGTGKKDTTAAGLITAGCLQQNIQRVYCIITFFLAPIVQHLLTTLGAN
jgi:hypothetical protein